MTPHPWLAHARPVIAIALLFAGALGLCAYAYLSDRASISPTCAFGDGQAYCAIERGERARAPYSRRAVVPTLARALPGALATRFRIVAVASLLVAAMASAALADRIARALGMTQTRTRLTIAAIVIAAGLTAPHGLRLAVSVPVLVDHGGLAAGLVWMVLFTSPDKRLNMASVPAALLAVCTREVWAIIIVPAVILAFALNRRRTVVISTLAVVIVGVQIMRRLPFVPTGYSEIGEFRKRRDERFSDAAAIGKTVWYLVFGVGLMPAVLGLYAPTQWLRSRYSKAADITFPVVICSAVVTLASATVSGADVPRLAYPAGIMLLAVSVPWLVAHRSLWHAGVVLTAGTLLIWAPTHPFIRSAEEYKAFYTRGTRASFDLAIAAVALLLAGCLTASAERSARTRATTATNVGPPTLVGGL